MFYDFGKTDSFSEVIEIFFVILSFLFRFRLSFTGYQHGRIIDPLSRQTEFVRGKFLISRLKIKTMFSTNFFYSLTPTNTRKIYLENKLSVKTIQSSKTKLLFLIFRQ